MPTKRIILKLGKVLPSSEWWSLVLLKGCGFLKPMLLALAISHLLSLAKVNESYDIPRNFLGKILHFCSLSFICNVLCFFLLLLLPISKYDCRILVLFRQFRNFELSNLPFVKVKIFNIADTYKLPISNSFLHSLFYVWTFVWLNVYG